MDQLGDLWRPEGNSSLFSPKNDLMLAYDAAVRVYLDAESGGSGVVEMASMVEAGGCRRRAHPLAGGPRA